MNVLIEFNIHDNESIKILIPNVINKFNTYCVPTEKVHRFDEILIVYLTVQRTIFLEIGILDDTLYTLQKQFAKALNNKLELPKNVKFNSFGSLYNYDVYFSDSENYVLYKTPIDYFDYALLSFRALLGMWIYEQNGFVYLEISQEYPFLFREPALFELFISFEDFMKDYKPLKIIKLDKKVIKQWSEQLAILIAQVEAYKAEGEL